MMRFLNNIIEVIVEQKLLKSALASEYNEIL
jgi:hypothetical protein